MTLPLLHRTRRKGRMAGGGGGAGSLEDSLRPHTK